MNKCIECNTRDSTTFLPRCILRNRVNYEYVLHNYYYYIAVKFACDWFRRTMQLVQILFEFSLLCSVKLSPTIQKQRHKSQTLFLRFTIVLRTRALFRSNPRSGCLYFYLFRWWKFWKEYSATREIVEMIRRFNRTSINWEIWAWNVMKYTEYRRIVECRNMEMWVKYLVYSRDDNNREH